MEKIYEIIDFSEHVPVNCFIHKLGYSPKHWHESIELIYILSGEIEVFVNNKKYYLKKEDILLINSNEIHELHGNDSVLMAIQIKLAELGIEQSLHFECNSSYLQDKLAFHPLKRLIARFIKVNATPDDNSNLMNRALAYLLAYELITRFKTKNNNKTNQRTQKYLERLTRILDYIHTHFKEDISLSQIADEEHLSIQYLSKFFSKNMNTNFITYVNRLKLNNAVNELLSSDESIETIAYNSGFPNTRAFTQLFKREYHSLPSQYRQDHGLKYPKEKLSMSNSNNDYEILEHRDYLSLVSKYLKDDLTIKEQKRTIVLSKEINMSTSTKYLNHTFKKFTSVGKAKELLYAEVQSMLTTLQEEIGFEYIKFHDIFSDELFVYKELPNGESTINFTLIDKVLDFLLSINLKPLIQLSFMPKDLSKYPNKKVFNSSFITSEPIKMEKWVDLVEQFTLHIIQRYGKYEVEQWKFCVWNEPDTSEKMFGFNSDETFYNFYKETFDAVKRINPKLEFGSPSTYFISWNHSSWLVNFTNWCKINSCLPDFINIHFYGTEFIQSDAENTDAANTSLKVILNRDENNFKSFVDTIKNYINVEYSKKISVYLTEWNYTPQHFDLIGDTCFKSCYLVKNILENYDRLDSFGYWVLTDFFEEYPIPHEIFHGGLGLFTYNGVKKAGYYALYLLNKLGDSFIDAGDGYFITKKNDSYQIMLYNYKHFSDLYAQGEYFDTTFLERYTPFGNEIQKEFLLKLNNISKKNYQVTEHIINKKYGSSFDKWVEMGASPLNKTEIESLKSLSKPMIRKYTLEVANDYLDVRTTLDQLEVKLLIIEPQISYR